MSIKKREKGKKKRVCVHSGNLGHLLSSSLSSPRHSFCRNPAIRVTATKLFLNYASVKKYIYSKVNRLVSGQNPPMQTVTYLWRGIMSRYVLKFPPGQWVTPYFHQRWWMKGHGATTQTSLFMFACSAGGRWQAGGGQADRDWWIPAQWAHSVYHPSRAASSAWGGGISTMLQVKTALMELTFPL